MNLCRGNRLLSDHRLLTHEQRRESEEIIKNDETKKCRKSRFESENDRAQSIEVVSQRFHV